MDRLAQALDRLERAVADPSKHEARWREQRGLEGTLGAWAGRPAPEDIAALDREHRDVFGIPLDAALRALLERFDGIAVAERWDGAPAAAAGGVAWADLRAIGEPVIWPAGYGGHFDTAEIYAGTRRLCAFGELADSGWIALAVCGEGAPVVWQDVEAHLVPPHVIARDLAGFLDAFVDADLLLPALLKKAKAPGWGD